MQALGVAAAPRELEEPRARRARDAQRVGQPLRVESVELAHRGGSAERSLRARIVKAAYGLEADGGARDPRRDLEAESQRGEERDAAEPLPLAHRERRRQHGAAGVRAGQGLALEGADEHAVGQRGARHVGTPAVMDHRGLRRAAEIPDHRHDASRPGQPGAHECCAERVQDGDLEVLDQPPGQVGERGLGDEAGERARVVHAPPRVYRRRGRPGGETSGRGWC